MLNGASPMFLLVGLFVMELETNQSSINTRRKELIVSFTEIGIAFKVIASDKVLNILPVVGNKSLAGRYRLYNQLLNQYVIPVNG